MQKHVVAIILAIVLWQPLCQAQVGNSLYQQLGERAGINELMTTFVLEIAEDERVIEHFRNVDIERFHHMLGEHLCELTGGPCTYTGADMVEVHRGMAITRSEFNAIVENLIKAMEHHQLPTATQNRLLSTLAELHGEIVGQ
ncbi:Group 1 truncated hemoglobin GlbN [Pseudidiomarina piscicola]|uniref:Group 1 truncated hemoglobin GlbN n=1 Tax=Pseudidiomarina piscicola TaxID=2614830 RepID=A0A6S6WKC1_9GAMM|nr:group 1 truncated hemoglobin [Pseudidiomarina piscicola]CAB0149631.1 Group 1 truncated hemoglobin GlbN [Pseudidiomarina piscicola]VZT39079.1 Group 1 truncated hemoglobin GlbN [Pseudomonas aeruginosa]